MDHFDREISAKLKGVANDNVRFTQEEKMAIRRKTSGSKTRASRFQPVYWTVLASAVTLFLFLGFIYANDTGLLNAGPDTDYMMPANGADMGYTTEDLEGIDFTIVKEEQLDDTSRLYTIELVNGSEHHLVDAVFAMSHPIKMVDGYRGNTFKAESRLNNIYPGETRRFEMELPSGIFDSEQVDVDSEDMDLTGYLNKIKGENVFQIGRSNGVFESGE
ncbi:hypothetical protein [Planococcus sp. CAU13]|uniref:hypothetical protein n=1 Tax=Planococcus sp. CAU13 TaxID=1541197 RepID=UPI00052FF36D|nr:hypothetical protein [Planococcus sp. CAU13]